MEGFIFADFNIKGEKHQEFQQKPIYLVQAINIWRFTTTKLKKLG